MDTKLLFDLIPAAILLGLAISGAVRGFFRTLANFAAVVVSAVGAFMLSKELSEPLAIRLYPQVETALQSQLAGLDIGDASGIVQAVISRVMEQSGKALESAILAVLQGILQSVLLIVLFFLLLALAKLVVRLVDKVFDLPVLHTANALCGFGLGLLEGILVLLLVLSVANALFPTVVAQAAQGTRFLSVLLTLSPKLLLTKLLG